MSKNKIKATLGFLFASVGTALGQPAPDPEATVLNGLAGQAAGTDPQSVESCWSDWTHREHLQEGKNERGSYLILVSEATAPVHEATNSRNWITAREAAFSYAELAARQELANTLKATIVQDRSSAVKMFGGDDPPPSLKPVVSALSLIDKTRVLADKEVDSEIKKYDPNWNGDESQKANKIVELQSKISQNIGSSTAIFASGAFTAVQCEGPSAGDDGNYSVLVGLIWSPVLAKIAESIWDPSVKVPPAPPNSTISAQFDEMDKINPDWMAYSGGARVYTDEKGNRVVVGFGVAPKTSLAAADQSRARLEARAAIQRFVGEKVAARETENKQFEARSFTDKTANSFDSSTYHDDITAISKEMQLTGSTEVASWRGEHPWSKAGMQVVAVAWSQAWANDSEQISGILRSFEQRTERKGAMPTAADASRARQPSNSPAATKAKSGAASSTKDF